MMRDDKWVLMACGLCFMLLLTLEMLYCQPDYL